ncbi:MAG TPA: hypothetical protein VIK93_04425, partial [Limnochordales bacterium]
MMRPLAGMGQPGPSLRRPLREAGESLVSYVCRVIAYGLGLTGFAALAGGLVVAPIFLPVAGPHEAEAVLFHVPSGSSAADIGRLLEEAGL